MKKGLNKSKIIRNTLGSLLILGALSGCTMLTEQTSSNVDGIIDKNNSHSNSFFIINTKEVLNFEEYKKLGIKKGDGVLVFYRDEQGTGFITVEPFSERQYELKLVKYSKIEKTGTDGDDNMNFGTIFIAPADVEFDYDNVIIYGENVKVI